MPDITMCQGYDCPLKENCRRYTVRPDDHQSFFMEDPRQDPKEHPKMCSYYWPAYNEITRFNKQKRHR